MKVQAITFTGRIKGGDIIKKIKNFEEKANYAVNKMEIKCQKSSEKLERKIFDNPKNPTPMDTAKMITTGTTSVIPIEVSIMTTI